jgi:Small subunit of acetolactate synthase
MMTVKVLPEPATTQRMVAMLRILCDITDRAEILHFVHGVNARAIMVRPRWIAFEMTGTPQEIEGIYGPSMPEFDRDPQSYISKWNQWWESEGRTQYAQSFALNTLW